MSELNESRRAVLQAVCDTVVPSIPHDPDPDRPVGAQRHRHGRGPGHRAGLRHAAGGAVRAGMMELLDAPRPAGLHAPVSQRSREQILRNVAMVGPEAAAGVSTLVGLTLFITYGAPDPETGQNPNWEVFGYPGPDRRAARTAEDDRADRARRRRARRSRPTCASSAPARAAA